MHACMCVGVYEDEQKREPQYESMSEFVGEREGGREQC